MLEEKKECCDQSCGCRTDAYATDRTCPGCGAHLRLSGNLQQARFRLSCPTCGYCGALLSQEELQVLL